MSFLQVPQEIPSIQPETIFSVGSFPITNSFLLSWVLIISLFLFFFFVRKRLSLIPSRVTGVVEMMVEMFLGLLDTITTNRIVSKKLLPLIGALLVYLALGNLIGLIPGLTAITYDGVALFRTPTNDFSTTFSIALAMILITQAASIKASGVLGHLGKYVQIKGLIEGFKQGIGEGFIALINFFLGFLDIVSEIAKVISLSLRLFGNMYAGEVLTALLFSVFALALPMPWLAINLLVGVVQALVFGSLTAAYYVLAVGENALTEDLASEPV